MNNDALLRLRAIIEQTPGWTISGQCMMYNREWLHIFYLAGTKESMSYFIGSYGDWYNAKADIRWLESPVMVREERACHKATTDWGDRA